MRWRAGGESPACRSQFLYSFSKNSQAEQEINTPPGTLRSRSFTRFTMRVGLPHFGQSVLLVVSITFFRSAVLAILTISSPDKNLPGTWGTEVLLKVKGVIFRVAPGTQAGERPIRILSFVILHEASRRCRRRLTFGSESPTLTITAACFAFRRAASRARGCSPTPPSPRAGKLASLPGSGFPCAKPAGGPGEQGESPLSRSAAPRRSTAACTAALSNSSITPAIQTSLSASPMAGQSSTRDGRSARVKNLPATTASRTTMENCPVSAGRRTARSSSETAILLTHCQARILTSKTYRAIV